MEDFKNYEFVGKNIKDVQQFYHLNFRIASQDGEFYMLTCDFDPTRFNFHIENDIIVKVTRG